MAKRWLTSTLPRPVAQQHDVPWDVYLKNEHRDRAEGLEPGDLVMFFEVAGVPGTRAADPNKLTVIRQSDGGVVADEVIYGFGGQTRYVAEVAAPAEGDELLAPVGEDHHAFVYPRQTYEDAPKFDLRVRCTNHRRLVRVDLPAIKERLGVKRNPALWHGLIEVEDVEAFDKLVEQHAKDFD